MLDLGKGTTDSYTHVSLSIEIMDYAIDNSINFYI